MGLLGCVGARCARGVGVRVGGRVSIAVVRVADGRRTVGGQIGVRGVGGRRIIVIGGGWRVVGTLRAGLLRRCRVCRIIAVVGGRIAVHQRRENIVCRRLVGPRRAL